MPCRIPFNATYPPELKDKVGPRNLLHTWATDTDDATVDPRWGKVGKQKIVDEGPLPPHPTQGIKYDMETVDDHILKFSTDFMEKAKKDGKPFFVWLNPTRMHVFTYLSPKYEALKTPENGWSLQEAGMAQFDDIIGSVMKKLEDMGVADNTIVVVTTDNGTETFTWPDGGNTPFKGAKGSATEGGFRSPAVIRWPGQGEAEPGHQWRHVGHGLAADLCCCRWQSRTVGKELLKGKKLGGKTYKVHLDGYDQTDMLTKGGKSARNEFWYFTQSQLAAARIGDFKYVLLEQPDGWLGQYDQVELPTALQPPPRSFRAIGIRAG